MFIVPNEIVGCMYLPNMFRFCGLYIEMLLQQYLKKLVFIQLEYNSSVIVPLFIIQAFYSQILCVDKWRWKLSRNRSVLFGVFTGNSCVRFLVKKNHFSSKMYYLPSELDQMSFLYQNHVRDLLLSHQQVNQ